jgi:hypothetical protein
VGVEDGIAERFEQIGREARVVGGGEGLQVELEGLGQTDEQRGRERTPVVLDQVQVARGDPELLGELNLRQVFPTSERPDLRS